MNDLGALIKQVTRSLRRKAGTRSQAEDATSEAVLRLHERQVGGEMIRNLQAVLKTEAKYAVRRGWRDATSRRAAENTWLLSNGVTAVSPPTVILPNGRRGPGQRRLDRCHSCRLWDWRDGRWKRRKSYQKPQFPRFVWRNDTIRLEYTCPDCPPHKSPVRVLYPVGELAAIPKAPIPYLAPTVPRIYSPRKTKGSRYPMAEPIPVELMPHARPPVNVTDDDLQREAEALKAARRNRPKAPIRIDGVVQLGTPMVCGPCRAANPFQLSCVHTFTQRGSPSTTTTLSQRISA